MDNRGELFRWMVDSSTDGLWILDEHGATTFANPRMAGLVGRTVEEMDGLPAVDALDEEGALQFGDHLADMLSGHPGEENVETKFVRPDGSAIWVLVSWHPLHDDRGELIGWLHRVTEYTERKSLVVALRDREQQLATAQRIAMIGSWEWEVATDTVTWSDQLYRIYNLQPQEFLATYEGFLEFVHPDDRPLVRQKVESTFAGEDEFSFDARIIRKGGEQRWIRGLGVVQRGPDGMPVKMGGTAQDITDLMTSNELAAAATRRLELLQQMATSANRSENLVEAVQRAAAGVPLYTTWSAVSLHLVGEDSVLHPVPLPASASREHTDPDMDLARRACASGRVEIVVAPGREDTHTLVAIPVAHNGTVACVIQLLADEVPPDENSMTLIEQIAGQLSQVAHREASAAQLAVARDQAMEASRLKSEFLATMSHEIRTPMNGVIGLNDLLMRTSLDDHQRRLVEGLQSAGLTLLGIINDILDLSKIESGKLELETVDFDVRAVFEQAAAVLSGPAHEKGLELVVACSPDVPLHLRGDAVRFGQVITNLGSNAVKFTDHGEVIVRAWVEDETAERVVVRVEVTDTGVGIAPGERERLFDAFTQADPSTTRRHGGTGLGLTISRQLVEALGGAIEVTSEVGKGSTFSFSAAFGRAETSSARLRRGPELLIDKRVLVVDDNETNRLILLEQLAAWKALPVAVASAEEALTALRDAVGAGDPFEIALLDLVMPGVDGLELARRVSADPTLGQLTMLLLSSDQSVTPQAAREAGIRASLGKPVRHSELYDTLLNLVAANRHERDDFPPASVPPLGIRVLVVEDNYVNQLVATGLIESIGCEADVAVDGAQAVDILTKPHDYAAVLMDCRMPRLDGFDATRAVRANEPDGQRVPIIAMTASALEGERERCLAAGMDDFVTKPVDVRELEAVIRKWTGAAVEPVADSPVETRTAPRTAPVLNEERIEMLDGLVKDGISFFERASASFMSNVGNQVATIRSAIDMGDATALMTSAHQLKGSALNLGVPLVGAAAARLEVLGETGHTTGTEELLEELDREVARALEALQEMLAVRP
ncbi:MAG TPA: response regulator [Nocardioides sp.]|nr:response regulator [Nocardioides sp.]